MRMYKVDGYDFMREKAGNPDSVSGCFNQKQ